ncbi:MAG: ABC transporter substrate-binding protein [Paenibacillaceae bacterium]|nr:ABC transporter substrate-binding protein [Paenibacillaceae bacterium]
MYKWSFKQMLSLLLGASLLFVAACSGKTADAPKPSASVSPSAGAASASPASASPSAKLDPVELTWYYGVSKQEPDQKLVQDEVNNYLQAKLNTTIKLIPVEFGNYGQKLNTVIAAGDTFDILWNGFAFNHEQNMRKGAFLAIDELLDKYAPNIKKNTPQIVWDSLKIEGKTYAIPNMQTMSGQYGVLVQKRLADKYKLDPSKIKKMEDLEPFLEQVKNGEKDIIPYGNFGNQYYPMNDIWGIPPDGFGVKKGDSSHALIRHFNEEAYKLASSWYKKGYIYKDAATSKYNDFYSKGLLAVIGVTTLKPGVEAEAKLNNGGNDVIAIPLAPVTTQGFSPDTLQSISRTSKHPDRAMMVLDLVNSDPYLYNLLCNGIEGKHYDKLQGGTIKLKENGAYKPNVDWVFGSVFNSYVKEGQPLTIWTETKKRDETAEVNPYGAFKFNSEPVKTEMANEQAVLNEYRMGLATGTLDFETTWPKVNERLQKAGEDKIFAEVQKQFDQFLKDKGMKK